jgi:hypothetical protein
MNWEKGVNDPGETGYPLNFGGGGGFSSHLPATSSLAPESRHIRKRKSRFQENEWLGGYSGCLVPNAIL